MALTKLQKVSMKEVDSLIFSITNSSNDIESEIRSLAKSLNIFDSIIMLEELYEPQDIEIANKYKYKCLSILNPVFEKLVDDAFSHFNEWYSIVTNNEKGLINEQMKMIYWMLDMIIRKDEPEVLKTGLNSRGFGKTWLVSAIFIFIMFYFDKYCIRDSKENYVTLIVTPSEKNMTSFLSYSKDFMRRTFKHIEVNLKAGRDNDNMLSIVDDGGIVKAELFYRLAGVTATGTEGMK